MSEQKTGRVPDGYMPIPTAEQMADALENVRCFHDMGAELIAPELLANLLASTTVKAEQVKCTTCQDSGIVGHSDVCPECQDTWQPSPSLPAAGLADLTAVRCQCCATEYPHDSYDAGFIAGSGMCQVCDAAIPAVDLPSAAPAEQPYPHGIAEDLERSDWAPLEALQWYAAGKHFDVADGRTRIIDTGAVASNALKHASLAYLELKGDAELSELRAALSAQQSAPKAPEGRECPRYVCRKCKQETRPPEPYKAYVLCDCGYMTAATIALAPSAKNEAVEVSVPVELLERLETWVTDDCSALEELRALLASHGQGEQHPDDDAVDRFAEAMKAKLARSREKGRHGWQTASAAHLSSLLYHHMYKADPLDVANLAMMLHQNGQAIELPQAARKPAQDVSVPRELARKLVRTYENAVIDAAHWTDMDGEVTKLRALLNGGEA